MKRIGLMSDTHGFIDEQVWTHFQNVDEIWHAGDIGGLEVAQQLADFKPFKAVFGNIDGAAVRARFPENLAWETEGLSVLMTHIGGYPGKYPARVKQLLREKHYGLFICGHSHILKVMPDPEHGLLHINPGACGNEGFHKIKTLTRFTVNGGRIQNLEVIELGLRGAIKPK